MLAVIIWGVLKTIDARVPIPRDSGLIGMECHLRTGNFCSSPGTATVESSSEFLEIQ